MWMRRTRQRQSGKSLGGKPLGVVEIRDVGYARRY